MIWSILPSLSTGSFTRYNTPFQSLVVVLDWWGNESRLVPFVYLLIVGTFVCYHLFGIGTFKGWAAIRFCLEYFYSKDLVLDLQPFHPDESSGLGKVGQLIVTVYWGALITVLSLFVAYRFKVFQDWTGVFAILVLVAALNYSFFISVSTIIIYQQAARFRRKQMTIVNGEIQKCQKELVANEIWQPHMRDRRQRCLEELELLSFYWNVFKSMSALPFTLRQLVFGVVFYVAQVAQIFGLFVR